MRVAFVGKGGSGKSTIAGTLARVLARQGRPVVAVDSDPMPGLAFSVGIDADDAGLPDEATEEQLDGDGPRYRLRTGLSAVEVIESYAPRGPDGIRFLQMGKPRGHVRTLARAQAAFHDVLDGLPGFPGDVVGDLPAGTRQPFFRWGRYAEVIVVAAPPTPAGMLSARRLARLTDLPDGPRVVAVASMVGDEVDVPRLEARTGLEVVGAVPWSPVVAAADRAGRPPIDHGPGSPFVRSVESLADRLHMLGEAL